MIELRIPRDGAPAKMHAPDIRHLKEILNRANYNASDQVIEWAWKQHSENSCAGWLSLEGYPRDWLLDTMLQFLERADGARDDKPA